MLGQDDGYFATGKMTEVYLRQAELHIFRRDRDVASGDDRKSAAEYPTVDSSDHRLRHLTENLIAPLARFLAHLVAHALGLGVHLDKILLQILPRAKTLTGSGDDDHARIFVVTQVVQTVIHLPMELRAHRVPLLRTIESDCGHAFVFVDQQSLIICHCPSSYIFKLINR